MAVATLSNEKKTAETAIQRELATMRILRRRLMNGILNRIFALDVKASNRRQNMLTILFLLTGFIITLTIHPWAEWTQTLQRSFTALFANQADLIPAFTRLIQLIFDALTHARTLSLLPVFVLPFLLSRNWAGAYLADIFEIEQIEIARKFIREVSLHGSDNELHISTSKIKEEEIQKSPITLIGGPGYVNVDLDTAILLEKPDGRPRVIGPTHDGHVVLDGFERIRDMIDLRDQIPNPFEVSARSKDGIPISIADVRVIFSVFRNKKPSTPDEPYPFDPAALHAMVFTKTHKVVEGERIHEVWYRSAGEPIWVGPMKSLISRDLGIFMGTRKLGEYLASIGAPETAAIQKLEQDILREKEAISGSQSTETPTPPPVPEFTSRSQLSGLFNEFAKKFNEEQQKRGVQAQWVGVGTWKMPPGVPSQVIPDKYLEAWRLTLENMSRGSEQALNNLEKEAALLELQHIIQKVPIQTHRENITNKVKPNQVLRTLMLVYSQQFNEAIEKIRKTNNRVPPSIVAAYYFTVSQIFRLVQPQIPPPKTTEEKKLYTSALARIGIPIAIEKLIALEVELDPNATRVECLQRIIDAWDRDMQ